MKHDFVNITLTKLFTDLTNIIHAYTYTYIFILGICIYLYVNYTYIIQDIYHKRCIVSKPSLDNKHLHLLCKSFASSSQK